MVRSRKVRMTALLDEVYLDQTSKTRLIIYDLAQQRDQKNWIQRLGFKCLSSSSLGNVAIELDVISRL